MVKGVQSFSIASGSGCPFCDKSFKANKRPSNSSVNRHIKRMAKKPDKTRKKHPKIGTKAYSEISEKRGFREVAPTEDDRKRKTTERKRKWKCKQRAAQVSETILKKAEQTRPISEEEVFGRIELMLDRVSSDIEDSTIIPKPVETLCENPTFPDLAFHYLPLEASMNENQRYPQSQTPYSLNDRHYLLLRGKHQCHSSSVLATAWKEWEGLGADEIGETQRKMQFERAKRTKSRFNLYRDVWKGTHGTDQERQEFRYEYYCRVAEVKSQLETGIKWEDFVWTFEELYEPLPGLGGTGGKPIAEVESFVVEHPKNQNPGCKRQEERVIYGTPEPELKRGNFIACRSPEL